MSYLSKFQNLTAANFQPLRGAYILVERLPKPERKTSSGLVLASEEISLRQVNGMDPSRQLLFVRVLSVGSGYFDEENEEATIPLESEPGDIVAVPFTSIKWFSEFGPLQDYKQDSIGLITEDVIQWNVGNEETYNEMFATLNKA